MNDMRKKTITFYGVYTSDDEMHGSFKAYCATRELAEEELKNHADWYNDHPEPDARHIIPLEMIVEDSKLSEDGEDKYTAECINRFKYFFGHHD